MKTFVLVLMLAFAWSAWAADLPDDSLTPGAVLDKVPTAKAATCITQKTKHKTVAGDQITQAMICTPGYTQCVRATSAKVKAERYKAYGIKSHKVGDFEADHRLPLELGGADVKQNLWIQSYKSKPWNAHVKDKLENVLHKQACDGTITMKEAQNALLGDWISAFGKYIGKP